jgi:putative transposase
MAGKYLSINLHMVWSTKWRKSLIDPQWSYRLYAYLGSIARAKNARLLEAKSMPNHIHSYVAMPSTITIAEMINAFKANSTRWIREEIPNRKWFAWQEGYGAFSVSRSCEKEVIGYIRKQQEHHKKKDFKEEFLELLIQNGIEYDLRYVFD